MHPGCRCPARHADLDHTVDHVDGGDTTEANSGPVCRHDHGLKHEGGWRLHQPESENFVWISPLGRIYHCRRQPITTDLPDPLPRPDQYPDYASPDTLDENGPILYRPLHEPDSRPPPARASTPTNRRPFELRAWLACPAPCVRRPPARRSGWD
ncbi:MAG: HNH endonuclease signature motif containing protein [Actinomycetes bacterium]